MTVITPPYQLPDLRPFRTIQNRMRLQGGAVVTDNGRLESDDFSTGVSGWRINGNGDVEFNDGVFRGTVDASALNLTISAADDGSIEFYNAALELVGRLSADSWEIGDLTTPGLRAVLDPVGGLRMRTAADELVLVLDQAGISIRDATTGLVIGELTRDGFGLSSTDGDTTLDMLTVSTDSLAKPRWTAAWEVSPSSSLVVPAATILTANDLELAHVASYIRATAQTATHTPPAGWTEVIDTYTGAASTLGTSLARRSVATGTTGTFTSSQTNWQHGIGSHVIVRGVVGGTTPSVRSTSETTAVTTDNTITMTMTKPTGTAAGDVLIAIIALGNNGGGVPLGWVTPEGWTFLGASVGISGSGASMSTAATGVWAKLAGSSEPASYSTDITFSGGGKTIHAVMVAVQDGAVLASGPQLLVNGENALGPWTDYTPSDTNVTVGNGTITAKYKLVGKTCFFYWDLAVGTTTSFGGSISCGLPFAAVSGPRQTVPVHILDSGTRNYVGVARISSGASVASLTHSESGNLGFVNGTNPMTIASGDGFVVAGSYEIA